MKDDHAEEILIHLGLIRPSKDTEFEDKFEFMKLWQLLNQMQREHDAREQAEAARRATKQYHVGVNALDSKRSESNNKINDSQRNKEAHCEEDD